MRSQAGAATRPMNNAAPRRARPRPGCLASTTFAARVASFRNVTHRPQKDRTAFPARDRPVSGHPTGPGAVARQHRRECVGPPPRELSSPRRRAPRWRSRRPPRAVRNRMSPSPSGTGHRSLNPNVTPPGLRPGAREGEPQARRCRSRVSVPSSAVERGPGRSARPVGRRHAQASRAGQRPGRTEPPRGRPDNRGAAAWQWAGSAPSPRRRAPRWRSRRPPRAVRNRMSPSPSGTGHRSLNPNVTPPGLRPGAREGEPQARRCRSRVSVPSSAVERGPGRSARPVGRRHAQASRAGQRPGRTEPPRGRPDNRGAAAWQWAGSAPSPRRRAPRWRSRRPPRAVRNRMSPSPSGTGHRSLNPNVTPPGLRPGAREGEPQARRCRSRVSVPSSAVERGPGRSARPVGRRHAQASRAGQRPGRTEPPRGRPDNRGTAVWQWAGSAPATAA